MLVTVHLSISSTSYKVLSAKGMFLMTVYFLVPSIRGLPGGTVVNNLPVNAGDVGSISGPGRSPGEGKWQPTPVFLLGKSHGQRSLAGYSP